MFDSYSVQILNIVFARFLFEKLTEIICTYIAVSRNIVKGNIILIAVNSAIFIGYRIGGWRGLVASVLGAVIPSFVIILLIAMVFRDICHYPAVEAVMKGMRPAVVGLLAAAVIRLSISFFKGLKRMLAGQKGGAE